MENLPDSFDVIVVGTGMPECIIAAAAARIGKHVLHLDRNDYYGGDWTSFSFDKLLEWIERSREADDFVKPVSDDLDSLKKLLKDDETLLLCNLKSKNITNVTVHSFIPDSDLEPSTSLSDNPVPSNVDSTDSFSEEAHIAEEIEDPVTGDKEGSSSGISLMPNTSYIQPEWTVSKLLEQRRKFNIDLAPKLLFSRGLLTELLISSNIAKYAEFQNVNRILTIIDQHIEQVPCSRADVFSTKNVTVVEKRMLMKFLTFCMNFQQQEAEYKDYENTPFVNFLKSKKLTKNVEHYIIHALAMADESCSTMQGLKNTQKFLMSLGRYGKSPFLCTCYGSAELPQSFCRLCAVYEGIYYLKRNVEAIVLKERCCAILSMSQRISCQWLIMESSYLPSQYLPLQKPQRISRGIFITNLSLYPGERNENILLQLPPSPGLEDGVTLLEFSSKTWVCPEDLYIVYMYRRSAGENAEVDLKPASQLLFSSDESKANNDKRPDILWCVYFNQLDTSTIDLNSNTPEGLLVTSTPDLYLDYDQAVNEARTIFERMFPGEEFLPRAPDPEDIVIDQSEEDDNSNIENDVAPSETAQNKAEEISHSDDAQNKLEEFTSSGGVQREMEANTVAPKDEEPMNVESEAKPNSEE